MTPSRSRRKVKLRTYTTTVDTYGQKHTGAPAETDIEMALWLYSHSKVEDPRFNDIDYVGLTYSNVEIGQEIKDGNDVYQIVFILPARRQNEVFLKKL